MLLVALSIPLSIKQQLINVLGIYNLWDEKPFDDHTAEDLMWFFQVNVVVSSINFSTTYEAVPCGSLRVGGALCRHLIFLLSSIKPVSALPRMILSCSTRAPS
jgi:hypothetical protein